MLEILCKNMLVLKCFVSKKLKYLFFCLHWLIILFGQPIICFVLLMMLDVAKLSPFCPCSGMLVWLTMGLIPHIGSSRSSLILIITLLGLLMFMPLMMLWNSLCFGVGFLIHFQLLPSYCVGILIWLR